MMWLTDCSVGVGVGAVAGGGGLLPPLLELPAVPGETLWQPQRVRMTTMQAVRMKVFEIIVVQKAKHGASGKLRLLAVLMCPQKMVLPDCITISRTF